MQLASNRNGVEWSEVDRIEDWRVAWHARIASRSCLTRNWLLRGSDGSGRNKLRQQLAARCQHNDVLVKAKTDQATGSHFGHEKRFRIRRLQQLPLLLLQKVGNRSARMLQASEKREQKTAEHAAECNVKLSIKCCIIELNLWFAQIIVKCHKDKLQSAELARCGKRQKCCW